VLLSRALQASPPPPPLTAWNCPRGFLRRTPASSWRPSTPCCTTGTATGPATVLATRGVA